MKFEVFTLVSTLQTTCIYLPIIIIIIIGVHNRLLNKLINLFIDHSYNMIFTGVTILHGVEFPIFLLIFAWAVQQRSATALPMIYNKL